jgi:pimeloyl-ACP methyl ester carboxylesterase
MAAVTPAALERFFSPGFANRAPQVVAAISRRLLSQAPAPYAQMCAAVREVNYLDRLGAVVCPTLVMTGANDLGTPPAMGQALAQRIPVARWVDIANAAHLGVLEQPGAYATEIGAFLAPL